MDKYKKSLIPNSDINFVKILKSNFYIYEEVQDSIGPIAGCGSYLHGGWSKDYSDEYYEKQVSLFDLFHNFKGNKCEALEIGTFDGSSGLIMLMASNNVNVTGVDICENYYPEKSTSILNKYFNNRYKLLKGSSNDMLNTFKLGTQFDFIHIDANHSYYAVSQDILNCIRFCHQDTLWIFDDLDNWGVSAALKFHQNKFSLINIAGTHGIYKLKSEYIIDTNKKLPTIVTALYDIRAMENNNADIVKNIEMYLGFGKELLSL